MLSNPRIIYGIHSFSALRISDGKPYGISKVLANGSLAITSEKSDLYGGSNMAPWATENTNTTYEISLQFKQLEDWMFEVFLGASVTKTGTSSGSLSALSNVKGALSEATTGVAGVSILTGSEANLKFGKYTMVAVGPDTVDVYQTTDIDFSRGVKTEFLTDDLKIAAGVAVSDTGGETNLTNFGFKITGGSGTVALTTGDSAEFEVLPAHNGASEIIIGAQEALLPEFEALMVAQRRSTNELFAVHCYKVKGQGLPIGFTEKEYAQPEVTATALYDQSKNRVAKVLAVRAV